MTNTSYRRILNEYSCYYKKNKELNKNFEYKITINKNEYENNIYIAEINFKNNIIKIYYSSQYPFKAPNRITFNNFNISDIYKFIMKYKNLNEKCLCCSSLLCNYNWKVSNSIEDILLELDLINEYKYNNVYKRLLKQICNKYTNQEMSYLYEYIEPK